LKRLGKVTAVAVAGLAAGAVLSPTAVEAATKYFSTTQVVKGNGVVNCPAGYAVTGGGYSVPQDSYTDTSVTQYFVTASYPTSKGWRVAATRTRITLDEKDGITDSTTAYAAKVYAICVG